MSNTSQENQSKKRCFAVDFRETSYHVAYIEADTAEEAKQMVENGEYDASHVETAEWIAFRAAELRELSELTEEIAVLHDDSDTSWENT